MTVTAVLRELSEPPALGVCAEQGPVPLRQAGAARELCGGFMGHSPAAAPLWHAQRGSPGPGARCSSLRHGCCAPHSAAVRGAMAKRGKKPSILSHTAKYCEKLNLRLSSTRVYTEPEDGG